MSMRNKKHRIILLGLSFILLILLSGCFNQESGSETPEATTTKPVITERPGDAKITIEESHLLSWEFDEKDPSYYEIYIDGKLSINITLNANQVNFTFTGYLAKNYTILFIIYNTSGLNDLDQVIIEVSKAPEDSDSWFELITVTASLMTILTGLMLLIPQVRKKFFKMFRRGK